MVGTKIDEAVGYSKLLWERLESVLVRIVSAAVVRKESWG